MNLDPEKILVLFVIAMLVLGPKRLPEAARTMGRWMAELRKYTSGFQSEFHDMLGGDPREQTSALRDELRSAFAEPRAALEAGARDAQEAANAAHAEVLAGGQSTIDPGPYLVEEPLLPEDAVTSPLNAVPDDPTLN